ncbi:MAG TPA: hypothetical protein VK821_12990, partial [Dehalococcoidia bacterium]|nr:hypothetical protein [Dehalococcoidia bacterium]
TARPHDAKHRTPSSGSGAKSPRALIGGTRSWFGSRDGRRTNPLPTRGLSCDGISDTPLQSTEVQNP